LRQHKNDVRGGASPVSTDVGELSTNERQRLKELERENRELRRSNDILRQASAYLRRQSSTTTGKNNATYGRSPILFQKV
jgi:transposase-like protein